MSSGLLISVINFNVSGEQLDCNAVRELWLKLVHVYQSACLQWRIRRLPGPQTKATWRHIRSGGLSALRLKGTAFMHRWLLANSVPVPPVVRKNAHCNGRRNATKLKCLLWHTMFLLYLIISKTQVQIDKRKANMASNIYSHRHLVGPALMAGAHDEI